MQHAANLEKSQMLKKVHNYKEIVGLKFHRLTAIKEVVSSSNGKSAIWLFKCDCGRFKEISKKSAMNGHTKSCGCLNRERRALKKHGHAGNKRNSKTYRTWSHMLSRCRNPKTQDYKYYGGRGISVCKEWIDFRNFLKDMGESPNDCEIDRIDNNLGYFKENCRWVTHKENCRNFRQNRMIKINGITKPLVVWAEEYSIDKEVFRQRINYGWNIVKALTAPKNSTRSISATLGNIKRHNKIYQYKMLNN